MGISRNRQQKQQKGKAVRAKRRDIEDDGRKRFQNELQYKKNNRILKKTGTAYNENFAKLTTTKQQEILNGQAAMIHYQAEGIRIITNIYKKYMTISGAVHQRGITINDRQAIQPMATGGSEYAALQKLGQKYGCWECGNTIEDSDSWIADHIPPFELKPTKISALCTHWQTRLPRPGAYLLYPSCKSCSSTQSALVKAINSVKGPALAKIKASKSKYIFGGPHANKCAPVAATSRATAHAHKYWKTHGVKLVCHICGTDASHDSDSSYIADHYPPREFNTHYARRLFEKVGIRNIPDPQVRPQCPRCSSRQGGGLSKASAIMQGYAKWFGITVLKG